MKTDPFPYDYTFTERYIYNKTIVCNIVCRRHNHPFNMRIDHHVVGHGCPICNPADAKYCIPYACLGDEAWKA